MSRTLLAGAFALYRALRAGLAPAPACRFQPTCSRYAEEALARHGLLRGTRLVFVRVLRCHPFYAGGHDPVPERI